ncbi:hypothetical protein [Nesterenkonia sp. F]|uniref:hypothetical protein n=1 Tax=Nesterenkonia sp. F TaxID=795955 RepID=UPI000255CA3E|nr:hypothetical protein [Nesterenkonia sp. F]
MRPPEPEDLGDVAGTEVRDTPAEVDAVFRTQRRIAVTYFLLFLLLVAAFPVLTLVSDWWLEARLIGDLSPGFLTVAVGLYVLFAAIGIAAATLSSSVESRMLGTDSHADSSADSTSAADADGRADAPADRREGPG